MKNLYILLFSLFVTSLIGQNVSVNNSGASAHPSAMLDVDSNSKGVLIPRMTSFQRENIASPLKGLIVFDNNTSSFWYYDGAEWDNLSAPHITNMIDLDEDTEIVVDNGFDNDKVKIDIEGQQVLNLGKNNNGFITWDVQGTSQNIAFGDNAGAGFVTGSFGNNLYGNFIMNSGEGSFNTIMGHYAGEGIVDANNNTIIGASAGTDLTTGDYNTFIGRLAGQNTTTANYNVFLGYGAGANENENNRLHIDNKTTSSPTESLIYGQFNSELVRINGELQIRDEYSFPETDGINGQVITTDGNGHLDWVDVNVGAVASDEIIDNDNDTSIKVEETIDDDIIRFEISGQEKFSMELNTSGISRLNVKNNLSNVGIGNNAGGALTNGGFNTIIGDNSGKLLTSGNGNTLIGNIAGDALTTSSDNTLIGNEAGSSLTGDKNVFMGSGAGKNMNNGNNNILIGYNSGLNNFQSDNVMIGYKAGSFNNGTGNVFIGNESGSQVTGSNQLAIDNTNTTTPLIEGNFLNDELTFNGDVNVEGVFSVNSAYELPGAAGNTAQVLTAGVGGSTYWATPSSGGGGGGYWTSIGGPSLKSTGDINVCVDCPGTNGNFSTLSIGNQGPSGRELSITSDEKHAIWVNSSYVSTSNVANGTVRVENGSESKMSAIYATISDSIAPTISATNTGKGVALSAYSFYGSGISGIAGFDDQLVGGNFSSVNGDLGIGVNALGTGVGVSGNCTVATGWDFYAAGVGVDYGSQSSRRWKTDIRNINDPISKIKALRGVYYNWDEEHGGNSDIGFIAEEIAKELPEIVVYDQNGVDVNGLDYSKTTPLILEALRVHIEDYENTIVELQEQLKKQEEKMLEINKKLDKLLE